MKKIILSAVCLASVLTASAQHRIGTFSVTPRVGVSVANVTNNDMYVATETNNEEKVKSRAKLGGTAGAEVEYQAGDIYSFSLGVMYAMQGNLYKEHREYADKTLYGISNCRMDVHELNIPLMANVYVAPGLAVKAGVQMGILLAAKFKYKSQSINTVIIDGKEQKEYGDIVKHSQSMKDQMHTIDFAIPVGLSYEYENVVLDARYYYGLTKVFKVEDKSKNSVFTFTVGYKFDL